MRKILVALLILALTCSLVGCKMINDAKESVLNKVSPKHIAYNEALKLIEDGEYEAAQAVFKELGDFKDSEEYLGRFHYALVGASLKEAYTEGGETAEESIQVNLSLNDKNLLEILETEYSEDDKYTYKYSYDDKGNLTKEEYAADHSTYNYIREYEYDENRNIIKTIRHDDDGDTYVYEYTYDKNGNVLKSVETYTSDSYSRREIIEYTYDSHNNEIKRESTHSYVSDNYNSTDTTVYVTNNTYNTQGNLIKRVEFNSFGEVDRTYEYEYDADGNMLKNSCDYSYGDSRKTEYTYDKSGNIVKEVYTYSDNDVFTSEYTYDEHGNVVKMVITDSDDDSSSTSTLTLEYKLVYIPVDMTDEEYVAMMDSILGFRPKASID